MTKGLAVNPNMFGGGLWGSQVAAFANAYANTDGFYNSSLFNSYNMDPMMSMMGMNPMMGMMNPFMMKMYNPAAYDAMKNGINPMESLFFGNSEKFATVTTQRNTIKNGIRQLVDYAVSDNQDDFNTAYQKLLKNEYTRLKGLMPNMDEAQLINHAKGTINTAFQAANGGVSIQKTLKDNADNPFIQGCKDIIAVGLLNDRKTVGDNVALVEDMDMNGTQRKREKRLQGLGRAVAGTLGAAAIIGGACLSLPITAAVVGIGAGIIAIGKFCRPD